MPLDIQGSDIPPPAATPNLADAAALHRPCYEHRFGEPGSVVHERSTALRNS
jgi:hypothetical protein